MKKVIGLSGVLNTPSRTEELVNHLTEQFVIQSGFASERITLQDFGDSLPLAKNYTDLNGVALNLIHNISNADALIVGVPTWNASFPGMFKHLLDLFPPDSLVNTPVILSATGGSERHALMPEYQLRPLFTYFRSRMVTTSLFATKNDFNQQQISPDFTKRVNRAVNELLVLSK